MPAILSPAPRQFMTLPDLLNEVRPFQYGKTWPEAFRALDRHYPRFVEQFDCDFLASIRRHGIRRPITIMRYAGVKYVTWGHHRVWAAARLAMPRVPYVLFEEGG